VQLPVVPLLDTDDVAVVEVKVPVVEVKVPVVEVKVVPVVEVKVVPVEVEPPVADGVSTTTLPPQAKEAAGATRASASASRA
jgi:hypothetical protein